MTHSNVLTLEQPLHLSSGRSWLVEGAFIGTTVLLPIVAHALGLSVLVALPMFWGVMLAGVVYGWPGGLVAALLSPSVNFLLTGMPVLAILPVMTLELLAYGTIPALLRDRVGRGGLFLSTAIGVVVGRLLLFLGFVLFIGDLAAVPQWAGARVLPGIPAQLVQIAAVPILGSMIVRAIRRD